MCILVYIVLILLQVMAALALVALLGAKYLIKINQ